MRRVLALSVALLASAVVFITAESEAQACGCLSPPAVAEGDFGVNQQSEQIIFEVADGFVTAHVLIRYAGAPEQFAWIVPAPEVPEFALSPATAFSLLENRTAPIITPRVENICPESEYVCVSHDFPFCGDQNQGNGGDGDGDGDGPLFDAGAGGNEQNPVEVLDERTIGQYQTITFSAGDMGAAVAWLNQEGFVVNSTMAPYMQPYADAGMVFVASKLVPGADVSAIKPLRMRFRAPHPMIPLKLTAVAAEPHMTITAYIYGDQLFAPSGHPLVSIPEASLSVDPSGRSNYPMVLARTIDAAGGDGFVSEYTGVAPEVDFDQGTGCCEETEFDQCGIGFDGVCSCPGNPFDEEDCGEAGAELAEGAALLNELASKHRRLTRITTRMSAHEMTFDPEFLPVAGAPAGRLQHTARSKSLASCESDIIDTQLYERTRATQECAAMYCGNGECVVTSEGAACRCPLGEVARKFTDLDGGASITCVSATPPVDLEAGGIELPDSCAAVDCGVGGSCVELAGFAGCDCASGLAATLGSSPLAGVCRPITGLSGSVGAEDFSAGFEDVSVCAPAPPASCGSYGWLISREVDREGVTCSSSVPDASRFVPPDPPTCDPSAT